MLEPSKEKHSGITTIIQSDDDNNLVLDFPTEILEAVGWKEGDLLDIQVFAGRIIFSKVASDSLPEPSEL